MFNSKLVRGLIVIGVGAAVWFSPVPAGLKPAAWHLLAIFVAVILGLILKPMTTGAVALTGITFSALSEVLKPDMALAGFGNTTIWLIVTSFLFSKAFVTTGLGQRIAYLIVRAIGDKTLKLAYAIILSDLVLAPFTPSNTARAGGVLYPIVRSLCKVYDSEPGPTARRIGSFLMKAEYQGDAITSAMFMTASSANTLLVALAASTFNLKLSWALYALAGLVPGIISLIVIPYFLYKVYPPEIKETPEARDLAEKELAGLGPVKTSEKILIAIFIVMLALWTSSSIIEIEPAIVAMAGVVVMIMTNVISWKEAMQEESAWDTMIWMGSLVALANALNKLGLIPWFAKVMASSIAGVPWPQALCILVLVYLYARYVFASNTAHVSALFPAFGAVCIAAGAPPFLAIVLLGFATHLSMSLTHYASGPSPIYFGSGYIDQGTWWKLGFVISLINLAIWGGIGLFWWKILGLW